MQRIISNKIALRKRMLLALKKQKEGLRLKRSKAIEEKFFALQKVKRARYIMFYLSKVDEVDTFRMIKKCLEQDKNVSVPVVIRNRSRKGYNRMRPCQIYDIKNSLSVGPFGIMQPKKKKRTSKDKIDLVVVPALAFDSKGVRLGRGRGYYDRFLSILPPHIYKIGLAFKFQILKNLPYQPHDIHVDKVLAA